VLLTVQLIGLAALAIHIPEGKIVNTVKVVTTLIKTVSRMTHFAEVSFGIMFLVLSDSGRHPLDLTAVARKIDPTSMLTIDWLILNGAVLP